MMRARVVSPDILPIRATSPITPNATLRTAVCSGRSGPHEIPALSTSGLRRRRADRLSLFWTDLSQCSDAFDHLHSDDLFPFQISPWKTGQSSARPPSHVRD